MKNHYLELCFNFLGEEIPNIIQIITFFTFLQLIFIDSVIVLIGPALLLILMFFYLWRKLVIFLVQQKEYKKSEFYRYNLNLKRLERTIITFGSFFIIVVTIIIFFLPYLAKNKPIF